MTSRSRKTSPRKILWITDPWETLDHPRDTTLRLAEECLKLGLRPYWCDVRSIRLYGRQPQLDAQEILAIAPERSRKSFQLGPLKNCSPTEFQSLHYRTDPPVNEAYLHPLLILALALRAPKAPELVNPLSILLSSNEKMEGAALEQGSQSKMTPPGLVSSQWEALEAFGKSEGRTVLKPLHEAQSHGVELLDWRNTDAIQNSKSLLTRATQGFTLPVLLQKYLPGISEGETRLWFVDGKFLAAVQKFPLTGDFRINMDRGSELKTARLSSRERSIATKIGTHLKKRQIRLAAVDLIEGMVTDFNFTSPGLIPQMESVLGENLARIVVKALQVRKI